MSDTINLTRTLPVNITNDDLKFFELEVNRTINRPSILRIENSLITSQGLVFEGCRLNQASLVIGMHLKVGLIFYLKQRLFKKKIILINDKPPVVVFDFWYNGYFHWITETLPRLLFLLKSQIKFNLIVPESSSGFILDSLRPFNIDSINIINEKEIIITRHALLVKHTAPTGNYNEDLMMELRLMFRTYFGQKTHKKIVDKIYVSRNKSRRRRVSNENDVITLLNSYGFETIYLEDYSFEDQVRLVCNANFMIGPHGAGLTNMLFMNAGASVLEFRHKGDATNLCYFSLASALQLNYYYQFGELEGGLPDLNDDIFIDINKLMQNVKIMLLKK